MAKRKRKKEHKIVAGLKQAIEHAKKQPKIVGRMVTFEDGRVVFLGTKDDMAGVSFIGFINEMGNVMKFTISDEALNALTALRADPRYGKKGTFPVPRDIQYEWQVCRDAGR